MVTDRALEVLNAGPLTLVQDLGRVGLAAVGVSRSGAADRGAFCLGARLIAQPYTAAALEVTLGRLSVRANGNLMLALLPHAIQRLAAIPVALAIAWLGYALFSERPQHRDLA